MKNSETQKIVNALCTDLLELEEMETKGAYKYIFKKLRLKAEAIQIRLEDVKTSEHMQDMIDVLEGTKEGKQ